MVVLKSGTLINFESSEYLETKISQSEKFSNSPCDLSIFVVFENVFFSLEVQFEYPLSKVRKLLLKCNEVF